MGWRLVRGLCTARALARACATRPLEDRLVKPGGGCGVAGYLRRATAVAPSQRAGDVLTKMHCENVAPARGDADGRGECHR